jgi:hypothetical protein
MPKPLKFPTKLLIGFDDGAIKAIDDWRRQQEDLPNRSESVRRLVALALGAWGPIPTKPVAAPAEPAHALKRAPGTKATRVKRPRDRRP